MSSLDRRIRLARYHATRVRSIAIAIVMAFNDFRDRPTLEEADEEF